jgi:hypothetical protein
MCLSDKPSTNTKLDAAFKLMRNVKRGRRGKAPKIKRTLRKRKNSLDRSPVVDIQTDTYSTSTAQRERERERERERQREEFKVNSRHEKVSTI